MNFYYSTNVRFEIMFLFKTNFGGNVSTVSIVRCEITKKKKTLNATSNVDKVTEIPTKIHIRLSCQCSKWFFSSFAKGQVMTVFMSSAHIFRNLTIQFVCMEIWRFDFLLIRSTTHNTWYVCVSCACVRKIMCVRWCFNSIWMLCVNFISSTGKVPHSAD